MSGSVASSGTAVLGSVLALAVTAALIPAAERLARRIGFVARPRADRAHSVPTPLLGGAACALGIASSIAAFLRGAADVDRFFVALAVGALLFLILGIADDRASFRPAAKALLQGAPIVLFWLIWRPAGWLAHGASAWGLAVPLGLFLIVNGWNYIDHADGVFAVNAIVASAVLAFLFSSAGDASGRLVAACAAGSLAGFLYHNRPPARIFLGDGGSLSLGFLLAALALRLMDSGGSRIGIAAAATQAPACLEIALVSGVRLVGKTPLFRGGVDHSGHRLALHLGPGRALAVAAAAAGAMMLAAWFAAAWFPGVGIPAMACLAVAVGFLVILLHLPAPS